MKKVNRKATMNFKIVCHQLYPENFLMGANTSKYDREANQERQKKLNTIL